ncbi:MAG: DNA recombination protein RmuC [Acholeplasmataceae bacterium]|nr:DNA recombination protein RmuC [Acholeplasmataceae bacterium]
MSDQVLLGLLILIIVLVLVLIVLVTVRRPPAPDLSGMVDGQHQMSESIKVHMAKEYGLLKAEMIGLFSTGNKTLTADMNAFRSEMMAYIEKRLSDISGKVDARLGEGFEKTTETFSKITERLIRIDEAQKKIETLSGDVVSLSDLLNDKKARGVFGEVQLNQILTAVFGESNSLYETQKTLDNKMIADAVVYAPEPIGMIAIDSKFPLENYRKMIESGQSQSDRARTVKAFEDDMRIHIKAIASKYLLPGKTADHAIMFIPAEAVFAELTAHHENILREATKAHVWITSPTTLIATLSMIQVTARNVERDREAKVIIDQLNALGIEFKRYVDRWEGFRKSLETVTRKAEQINRTSHKISTRFDRISNAGLSDEKLLPDSIEDEEEDDTVVDKNGDESI